MAASFAGIKCDMPKSFCCLLFPQARGLHPGGEPTPQPCTHLGFNVHVVGQDAAGPLFCLHWSTASYHKKTQYGLFWGCRWSVHCVCWMALCAALMLCRAWSLSLRRCGARLTSTRCAGTLGGHSCFCASAPIKVQHQGTRGTWGGYGPIRPAGKQVHSKAGK